MGLNSYYLNTIML